MRFFNFDNEIRIERFCVCVDDGGSCDFVFLIGVTATDACGAFDEDFVPAFGELVGGGGEEGNAVFLLFYFTWNSNFYEVSRRGNYFWGCWISSIS